MYPEAIVQSLDRVCERLNSLGVPFALMGGLAVSGWKHARFTQDVDLLIACGPESIDRLVSSLAAARLRPKRTPPIVTVGDSRFMQFVYEPPDSFMDIQIDLLLAETEFQKESLARRQNFELPGVRGRMSIVSCEDLILFKLLAGRVIDRADASAVLRLNRARIDLNYLKKWIDHFDLQTKWTEIWDEAFPDAPAPA